MSSPLRAMVKRSNSAFNSSESANKASRLQEVLVDPAPTVDRRPALLQVMDDWSAPSDFWTLKHLLMSSGASSAADWLRWLQVIEAYFRNHKYLFSILKYGCFQLFCTEFG